MSEESPKQPQAGPSAEPATPSKEHYMVFNLQETSVTLPQGITTHNATENQEPSQLSLLKPQLTEVKPQLPEIKHEERSKLMIMSPDLTLSSFQYRIKPTKPRTDLSLASKVSLIKESMSTGKSQRQLAAQFGISLGSVNNILRRKHEYVNAFESDLTTTHIKLPKKMCPKKPDYEVLNALVLKWAKIADTKNTALTKEVIQEKAKEFAKKLQICNFNPSQNWTENIQKTLQLQSKSQSTHENSDLTTKLFTLWMKMLPYLVQGYEPENVFTCGETTLFYKGLPDKCYTEGGVCLGSHHTVNIEDHRFTILFCCSATGEKLQPLVVGSSAFPFSCLNLAGLPVTWKSQTKAFMTSALFAEWLQRLDLEMENQGRRIALFMDMAPAHLSSLVLKNVSLKFYMDNSSSYLQPLQQGMITAFKAHYRRRFLQAVLARVEYNEDPSSALKSITELDAIYWIKSAWDGVTTSLICNCFDAVGFSTSETSSDEGNNSLMSNLPELVEETAQALKFSPMHPEVYAQFDSRVPCYIQDEEDWEKELLAEALGHPIVKSEPVDTYESPLGKRRHSEGTLNSAHTHQVLQSEAIDCLSKLKLYAVNDALLLTKLYSLEESMLESISAKRRRARYRNMNVLHVG